MSRSDPPRQRPPMLARRLSPFASMFDAIDREAGRLKVRLSLFVWTLANDPDESTQTVAAMPRALDLAAGRVS